MHHGRRHTVRETIGIVWNPSKATESELRTAAAAAVTAAGGDAPVLHWFETSVDDPGAGAARAARTAGCSVVVAAGGDGTVRAVAGALGETAAEDGPSVELGIIPLGTGNLLARNLGVPLGDAEAAFARVLTGDSRTLDLGEATITHADGNEEVQAFVVMVGFGIDAQMIVETDDELKARAGWLAYVESLGRAAAETEVVEFSLSLDGKDPQPEQAHTLLVANCGTIQGGITLLPDAEPDDGELDMLVLRADGVAAWLDTMRNMVWENGLKRLLTGADRAESSETTGHLRAKRVRVELPHPHAFEVDGDDFEDVIAFEARILPAALRVR